MVMELSGNPPTSTAQQKGSRVVNGKRIWYKPAGVRQAEAWYAERLRPYIPDQPLTGPLELYVRWRFSPPKGMKLDGWTYKLTAPDLDNSVKVLQDELQHLGFFANDACIVRLTLEKVLVEKEPGVTLVLSALSTGRAKSGALEGL